MPSTTEDKGLKPRSPIVAIIGHVDHGKTSLLDYIRKHFAYKGSDSRPVADREAGDKRSEGESYHGQTSKEMGHYKWYH